jgi:phenylpropionate dioxygenase-like ring-hydroxylating dioxygenase large terminal subunit
MSVLEDLQSLVAWEKGMVFPAIYFDEEVYRREHERIFEGAWLPVGHEDMIRNNGDYVTNYMGEVPIVLVRDRAGVIRVFINKCRHRGNEVCLFDRGNVRAFTCSYHGWTYGVDGRLISVPEEREFYHGVLEKERWGLEEAGVVNFHGLIFATLNREGPSFEDWLGADVRWWLQHLVLAEPIGGLEALPGWHRYRSPANWKLMAENFIGDNYHFVHTHSSWIRVMKDFLSRGIHTPMTTSPLTWHERTYEVTAGYRAGRPLGISQVHLHTDAIYERDLELGRQLGKAAAEWIRERNDRMAKALADYEPRPDSYVNGLLFPNLGLLSISPLIGKHFLLFHPRGPEAHEVWQWTMVEREAPDSIKEIAIQRVYQGQSMAGVIAPDDVENFERIVEASRSPRTWRMPMNYEIHLGHDEDQLPHLPGNCGAEPSEVNQREFYRAWLELMGESGAGTPKRSADAEQR